MTNEAKHTPGPWRVVHHDSTAITVRGQDDLPVAEMWKTGLRNDQANAELIARAPELLADNARLAARVAELEPYRQLFNHAIDCVDCVFQDCETKAMLPDFLPLGSCKFEGVKKLATAYMELQSRVKELEAKQ